MRATAALDALDALAGERGLAALERDAPLAPLTTLRVGGPADRLAVAASVEELVELLRLAAKPASSRSCSARAATSSLPMPASAGSSFGCGPTPWMSSRPSCGPKPVPR